MEFARKASHIFVFRVLAVAISFISSMILARSLGPEKLGIFNLVFVLPNLLIPIFILGLPGSNVYFLSKQPENRSHYIANTLYFSLLLSIAFCVFFYLALDPILHYYYKDIGLKKHFFWVLAAIPFLVMYRFLPSLLRGLYKISELGFATLFLRTFLTLILYSLLLLVFKMSLSGALISFVLVYMLLNITLIYLIRKNSPIAKTFHWGHFKTSMSFGWKTYLGGLTKKMVSSVDLLMMVPFLSAAEIGFYAIGKTVARQVDLPKTVTSPAFFPKIASLKSEEAETFMARYLRFLIFGLLLFLLCICLVSPFVIKIAYGNEFLKSISLVFLIAPGVMGSCLFDEVNAYFMGTGRPLIRALFNFLRVLIAVILLAVLLPRLGLYGACIGMSVAHLTSALLAIGYFLSQSSYLGFGDILLPKKADFEFIQKCVQEIQVSFKKTIGQKKFI